MIKILCNDVLGITVEEARQLDEIEGKKLLTVNVITPNGENVELCYSQIEGEGSLYYLYPISQNGNYTFKATNSKGRSSEVTVSVVEASLYTPKLKYEIQGAYIKIWLENSYYDSALKRHDRWRKNEGNFV